jgi:hypothetical protein
MDPFFVVELDVANHSANQQNNKVSPVFTPSRQESVAKSMEGDIDLNDVTLPLEDMLLTPSKPELHSPSSSNSPTPKSNSIPPSPVFTKSTSRPASSKSKENSAESLSSKSTFSSRLKAKAPPETVGTTPPQVRAKPLLGKETGFKTPAVPVRVSNRHSNAFGTRESTSAKEDGSKTPKEKSTVTRYVKNGVARC